MTIAMNKFWDLITLPLRLMLAIPIIAIDIFLWIFMLPIRFLDWFLSIFRR
jgi:hypothetical protein